MNKKIIITAILLILLSVSSTKAQQRYTFGNIIFKDSSGSIKIETGGLYTSSNLIGLNGSNIYLGGSNNGLLEYSSGILSIGNKYNTDADEIQFMVYHPEARFRWLADYTTTVMLLGLHDGLRVYDNLRCDSIFATKSCTVTLDTDDREVDTKTSYIRIDSDDPLSTNRTFTLSDGTYGGQELFLSFIAAFNQAEIIDVGSEAGLNGDLTFDNPYESLTLKWDNTLSIWMEQCRVDN